MMARPVKPRKHTKEEISQAVGKEVLPAERRKLSKKLQNPGGNLNQGNGEETKETVGNIEKNLSKKEIRELIDSQQRLQEELESKNLEITALRQLVDSLVEGAVPLSVPVEVFYNIGQQYLEKNTHAFSLQFPPIEDILFNKTETTGGDVEVNNDDDDEKEESLDELEGLEDLDEAAEETEETKEEREKVLEERQKDEMLPKSIAERKAKSLLALEAWQREEGLAATFNGLVKELEMKNEMNEALLQQNEIMKKQNQMLTEQIDKWEKEFSMVDKKYQELQDKVILIIKQAETLMREKKENQIFETNNKNYFSDLNGDKPDFQQEKKTTTLETHTTPIATVGNNRLIPVVVTPPTFQQKKRDCLQIAEPEKSRQEERALHSSKVIGVKTLFPSSTKTQVLSGSPETRWIDTAAPCYVTPSEQAALTHTSAFLNKKAETVSDKKRPSLPSTPFSFRPLNSPSQSPAIRR